MGREWVDGVRGRAGGRECGSVGVWEGVWECGCEGMESGGREAREGGKKVEVDGLSTRVCSLQWAKAR